MHADARPAHVQLRHGLAAANSRDCSFSLGGITQPSRCSRAREGCACLPGAYGAGPHGQAVGGPYHAGITSQCTPVQTLIWRSHGCMGPPLPLAGISMQLTTGCGAQMPAWRMWPPVAKLQGVRGMTGFSHHSVACTDADLAHAAEPMAAVHRCLPGACGVGPGGQAAEGPYHAGITSQCTPVQTLIWLETAAAWNLSWLQQKTACS